MIFREKKGGVVNNMNKNIVIAILTVLLASCATQYMISTNFHQSLAKGMTKEQFDASWVQPTNKNLKGNMQVSSRRFTVGDDQWEILIYNVYEYASVRANHPKVDHKEYVAFRNGFLEEWGMGTLPVVLQGKPEIIHIESGR